MLRELVLEKIRAIRRDVLRRRLAEAMAAHPPSPAKIRLLADAGTLQQAGVFALVLECMPAELGAEITKSVDIPTIGIGAGPDCDGQILVVHDMLGLQTELSPKFVKRYASLADSMTEAFTAYMRDVESGDFPTGEHSY